MTDYTPSPFIIAPMSSALNEIDIHAPVVYSPNTPPNDSLSQDNVDEKMQDFCRIVHVDTIEDLEVMLWKVKKFNDNLANVKKKQRDIEEARTSLNAKEKSLRGAQFEKAKSSQGLGLPLLHHGAPRKRKKLGKSERKIINVQHMLDLSVSHGSTSSKFHSPK